MEQFDFKQLWLVGIALAWTIWMILWMYKLDKPKIIKMKEDSLNKLLVKRFMKGYFTGIVMLCEDIIKNVKSGKWKIEHILAMANEFDKDSKEELKSYDFEKKVNEKYPMCEPEHVQLDCRVESCRYHKPGKCTNIAPAISLNSNQRFVCWTKDSEE